MTPQAHGRSCHDRVRRYHHPKDKPPVLLGYTATYHLTVTARKLDRLGRILDDVVAAGANRDVGVSFGCAEPEKALDEARARAVADARKKAKLYTEGAGASLGGVVAISEGYSIPQTRYSLRAVAKFGDGPLPIAAGEQELSVTVTVEWTIANPRTKSPLDPFRPIAKPLPAPKG